MKQSPNEIERGSTAWIGESTVYEGSVRHLIAAAQMAAVDNRQKARAEARLGSFKFAKLHEVASLTYEDDAAAMIETGAPIHLSLEHYRRIDSAYRRVTEKLAAVADQAILDALAS